MFDHTTGICFLVDNGTQISSIPATKEDKKGGLHKFTLQAVNKSLIQTYSQRCLTLNLGLKLVFTNIFVIADMEKAILEADFLRKYGLLVDINKCSLMDPLTDVRSSGSVCKGFPLSPSMAKMEENPTFYKLLKKFSNLAKPSFHKETLPHSINHYIIITDPPVHNQPRRLALEKLSVAKDEFSQMMEMDTIHPSKSN